jgi:hydrogenase expression/formation protein HypC
MCLAVPGRVVTVDTATALATGTVDFGGARRRVCLAYVPEAQVGDHVVVHAGFAISTIDAAEAARAWEALERITEIEAELGPRPQQAGEVR